MRALKSPFASVLLLLILLLVAACSGEQPAQETGAEPVTEPPVTEPTAGPTTEPVAEPTTEPTVPTTEPTVEPVAEGHEYELGESYEFGGFGFSMAIPAGWHADTRGTVTMINELESDHATAFREEPPPREGYQIVLDHRDAAFMADIGLGEDPTLQDLLELNREFFEWQEPVEVSESKAFGVPALAAKAFDGEDWGYGLMGFVNDEAFLLGYSAPSKEALDEFLPTWEQMVASIEPTAKPTASAARDDYTLDETHVFDDFGFSIAIPAGWHADTRDSVTMINELESDHVNAFQQDSPPRVGYQITLEHRDLDFMATIGLGEESTLQDLYEFNKDLFNWQEPIEVSDTTAFGAPALAAKAFDGADWIYALMGFVNEEVFLMTLRARSEEARDAFLPTLEEMAASITPAE